jgi:DUF971 family protein
MKIAHFIIDNALHNLTIEFSASAAIENTQLSFEYLRISSPANSTKKTNQVISHKKDVLLVNIESVAKHGYRFIFDDDHSAIYSEPYIQTLVLEYELRWQYYLAELKTSGHSRDTMIDFKQL